MCYKIKYNKKECLTELNRVKSLHKKYRRECRYYFCESCNGFHLTSHEEYEEIEAIPLEELKMKEEWVKLMQ